MSSTRSPPTPAPVRTRTTGSTWSDSADRRLARRGRADWSLRSSWR
jgi:hypothetical protein